MKQKFTASLLVLALVSAIAVSAFATETTAQTPSETTTVVSAETPVETTAPADTAADAAEEILSQPPVVAVEEASANMVMFADLAGMVKKNSPSYNALMANAAAIDEAADQVDTLSAKLEEFKKSGFIRGSGKQNSGTGSNL